MRAGAGEGARRAWDDAPTPSWAASAIVPSFLALREGVAPVVVVAPHGARRRRPIRRGDSVNDLHTDTLAWELAERLDAHAIVNHGLDRNEVDLNRISHLVERADGVLELLHGAVLAASAGGAAPLVVFVHGWNMVVPCCDVGIGLRRRAGVLAGSYPTVGPACRDEVVRALERELPARGIAVGLGRRYPASGRDNAVQLFSGRHADHANATVANLARLALEGRVDGVQLELGIPLRWPGALRAALLDGLVAAIEPWSGRSPSRRPPAREPRPALPSADGPVPGARGWSAPAPAAADQAAPEAGWSLQASLDDGGRCALFAGVEATGDRSMAARLCVVCADGSMLLMVGEGEWGGERGRYEMDGFAWRVSADGERVEISLRGPMVRYRTHAAYMDLEQGLSTAEVVDAQATLVFDVDVDGGTSRGADAEANRVTGREAVRARDDAAARAAAALRPRHGRLHGRLDLGVLALDVDRMAFVERGGRRASPPGDRVRVLVEAPDGAARVLAGDSDGLRVIDGPPARIRGGAASGSGEPAFAEGEVVARVPVLRPHGDGSFSRWTFGIVRCRFDAGESVGVFETVEVFRRG